MKNLLALAAISEGATGLVLLAYPPLVVSLLLGAEITGAGIFVSRIAGISLIALGIACWPGNKPHRPLQAMFMYSLLTMLYLAYVGLTGVRGILLRPAVAAHAVLSIFLVRALRTD